MKLGPVIKLDKKHRKMSTKYDHDIMSKNCDVIAVFRVYGQFGPFWKLDSGCIVCKT